MDGGIEERFFSRGADTIYDRAGGRIWAGADDASTGRGLGSVQRYGASELLGIAS